MAEIAVMIMAPEQLRRFCITRIKEIVATSADNTLQGFDEPAWEAPLVEFAAGDDPLFQQYKEIIGACYWTPKEAMAQEYADSVFPPEQLRIVSWILP